MVINFPSLTHLLVFSTLFLSAYSSIPSEYLKERKVIEDHYERPAEIFTERPVIGVLTLPVTVKRQLKFGNSSFATSYIRWVEAGGARTLPILYDSSKEELDYILNRINGVLWTGGLVDFNPEVTDPEGSKYLTTTQHIFRHVTDENDKGNYYPIWGTCLGFERLSQLVAGDKDGSILEDVDAENFGINLQLTSEGWMSRIFGGMTYELFKEVASPLGHLAFNNHGLGIHPDVFRSTPLNDKFKILSIDEDRNGKLFVSTVEGRDQPFYASQWHPEKASWEWTPKYAMSHTENAITFSNYLGRFFVNECKFNKNKFENETLLNKILSVNWPSRSSAPGSGIFSAYSEITFFKKRYPVNLAELGKTSLSTTSTL